MIIAFVGPSGVGKSYTALHIVGAFPSFTEITWATTRPMRLEEQGRLTNRKHLDTEEFARRQHSRTVLLSHQTHGHWYGILAEDMPAPNMVSVTELHVSNIDAARLLGREIVLIGLVPVSIDFLRMRLVNCRGMTDAADVERRLIAASKELRHMRQREGSFHRVFTVSPENEGAVVANVFSAIRRLVCQEPP